jgi:hypothetical protein
LTSALHAAFAYGDADIGLVMGGSGTPIPGSTYVTEANDLFIANPLAPDFPDTTYPGALADGLFTPEGLYPSSGVKSLPLDTSLTQGVTILNNEIQSNLAAGDATTVFGYSQSTLISSLEMAKLDPSGTPSDLPVHFVLIGNEVNPNGGALSRFDIPGDNSAVASLGINFQPATPADSFPTDIYTREYDGFADFPRYPLNLLADLNAEVGILTVHNTYLTDLTAKDVASAIVLPTSGPTETTYYMIPTENLPLLDLLRGSPVGNAIADLLQPDLKVLINLGYGADNLGYSDTAANVPTTFGLFPDVNPATVLSELATGAQTGIQHFMSDISNDMSAVSTQGLSALFGDSSSTPNMFSDLLTTLSTALSSPASLASSLTEIVNAFSAAASTAYATLLPTADIVNALLTSLPAYDATVFMDNISNPLEAVGLTIAATTGLIPVAAGLELEVLANAATAIAGDFSGIAP